MNIALHNVDVSGCTMSTVALEVPLFLPIMASALMHSVRFNPTEERRWRRYCVLVFASLLLWSLPPHVFTSWWKLLTLLLCQWPKLPVFETTTNVAILRLKSGGPLGRGCSKICEVAAACILWTLMNEEPIPITLGPMPSAQTWGVVVILCLAVNITLLLWSRQTQSCGDHKGVNSMVESSIGRELELKEHFALVVLAVVNAACEEISSRGFWYCEYQQRGMLSPFYANLIQAACFGIWHYHGIPSGWAGVGLTFVYGYIMGLLYEYDGQGLLLPIVAHTVADYYIFAAIARHQHSSVPTRKQA